MDESQLGLQSLGTRVAMSTLGEAQLHRISVTPRSVLEIAKARMSSQHQ